MTLADQFSSDMSVFFNTDDFAETVTYNGSDIDVIVVDTGTGEDANSVFDFLDIEVQVSDMPTVTYRTDTVVYGGLTYKYPKITAANAHTVTVRYIRNQRPVIK